MEYPLAYFLELKLSFLPCKQFIVFWENIHFFDENIHILEIWFLMSFQTDLILKMSLP